MEGPTVPDLTSASYPLIYTEKRWGRSPFQHITFLIPDAISNENILPPPCFPLPPTKKNHYSIFSPKWARTLARSPHIKRISLESSQYTTEPNSRLWVIGHHERRQDAFLVMVGSVTPHCYTSLLQWRKRKEKQEKGNKAVNQPWTHSNAPSIH